MRTKEEHLSESAPFRITRSWLYTAEMTDIGDVIIPNEWRQLSWIAWNRDLSRPIDRQTAFALYKRNWRFIEPATLSPEEARLIADLMAEFEGNRPSGGPPRAE